MKETGLSGVVARMKKERAKAKPSLLVLTIGHSTRSLEDFIHLLKSHEATCVGDVRTVPRSKHNPQFNKDSLPFALKEAGLTYVHLPGLGGLRHPKPNSLNLGWRNVSFRGFADYMQTPEFARSLKELIRLANQYRMALMCAEAVPWRCHRSLIADALSVRGIRTEDIMSLACRSVHVLTPFAKVCGTVVTYPPEARQIIKVSVEILPQTSQNVEQWISSLAIFYALEESPPIPNHDRPQHHKT